MVLYFLFKISIEILSIGPIRCDMLYDTSKETHEIISKRKYAIRVFWMKIFIWINTKGPG